ncbi:3',5'-cyclic-nucleotide phosphodiesterase [Pseudarcicella hirudinis]|uniref:3',5'-cyclic-nucleotide phosphodiesterase n=1 Tax=Pseudarcicella hirudinis TaxID=1079859 RepID=A0A1I5SJH5_9BACT|nr:3',5'-cyclic-nucleotide phosphodiesterase [Pseudarcicella hirudinis]SFP70879.1 3',5'-cyclic-nucleotide phosphodiesterase [Pseudarcicella hirudinis]
MNIFKSLIFSFFLFLPGLIIAQGQSGTSFHVVPLGVKGGTDESNLSSYMLAPADTRTYICLDAGTIYSGIDKAVANGVFKASTPYVLKKYIKGYLISHAHLDHVSGLIINSPADSSKTVYATADCMKMMENHYFNDETWANFGDEGKGVHLKKYHFQTLELAKETPLENTGMTVQAFPLSHINPYQSTAYLVNSNGNYILYLGDTGPDEVEKSDKLRQLWQKVAPLVQNKSLKGIFIEVSFPTEQPDKFLFGHLTPKWLMNEMNVLAGFAGKDAVKGLNVIITHLKPPLSSELKIKEQLKAQNPLGLEIIFPEQGKDFKL